MLDVFRYLRQPLGPFSLQAALAKHLDISTADSQSEADVTLVSPRQCIATALSTQAAEGISEEVDGRIKICVDVARISRHADGTEQYWRLELNCGNSLDSMDLVKVRMMHGQRALTEQEWAYLGKGNVRSACLLPTLKQ